MYGIGYDIENIELYPFDYGEYVYFSIEDYAPQKKKWGTNSIRRGQFFTEC